MRHRRGMMPNDFPTEEAPSFLSNVDPGDENDAKPVTKPLACDTCGSTEKPLSVNSMKNEFRPGEVSCSKCIFDRGNAAARRLAARRLLRDIERRDYFLDLE